MTRRMLNRALLLCLGLWLIAASALTAHAGPCDMREHAAAAEVAAAADVHAHCDMVASEATAPQPDLPDTPDKGSACCCPAVLAAVPAPDVPQAADLAFTLPADFPADASAPSRTLIPEPPPPKA